MTKRLAFILSSLLAAPVASASNGTCKLDTGAACTTVAPPAIAAPSGMGQYCSVTYAGGGWGFSSGTSLTADPCSSAGTGATIAHAGLYSAAGTNNVVERCTDGRIGTWRGAGNGPLTAAYNDAANNHRPGCTFAVTPESMPVFQSPFSVTTLPTNYSHGTGMDFARFPYYQIDLLNDRQIPGARDQAFILDNHGNQKDGSTATEIGAASNGATLPVSTLHVSSTASFPATGTLEIATIDNGAMFMTYTGKTATTFTGLSSANQVYGELAQGDIVVEPSGYVDDHQGNDFNMADGTPLYAVADGVVDMSRARDVSQHADTCPFGPQNEIYIRHRISGGIAKYDEVYESYYAHMSSRKVATGQIVHKGDLIGYSGHTGCASGPHLHLSVFRLSNTASAYSFPLIINTGFGAGDDFNSDLAYRQIVEPYGFWAPTSHSFDPWGWMANDATKTCYDSARGNVACDWGALSPDLWESGQEPPEGSW
jgi:murein DD-endopeptidase MepM/ murein hydrolase activator NlpD|nr:M23 family metallopeptidase [Kofleriaceae bacterium]